MVSGSDAVVAWVRSAVPSALRATVAARTVIRSAWGTGGKPFWNMHFLHPGFVL
jgi:hypothetical protein